jgi:nucleoid DNA-binding protein
MKLPKIADLVVAESRYEPPKVEDTSYPENYKIGASELVQVIKAMVNNRAGERVLTNAQADILLHDIVQYVLNAAAQGAEVRVPGFGVFHRKYRKASPRPKPNSSDMEMGQPYYFFSFRPFENTKRTFKDMVQGFESEKEDQRLVS